MAESITKRICDAIVSALSEAAPAGCIVKRGRKAPTRVDKTYVQVYWLQETVNNATGNRFNALLHARTGVLEIKVTVPGDDDAFDMERQWIIATMFGLGNLDRLAKSMNEAETVFNLEESSEDGTVTASAIRYAVEYTTRPGDITSGN